MSWFFCSKKLLFAKSRLFSRLRYLYVRTISFRVRARRVPRGSLVCVSLASVAARRGRIARTNENRRTWVVIPAWVSFLPVLCLSLCPCVGSGLWRLLRLACSQALRARDFPEWFGLFWLPGASLASRTRGCSDAENPFMYDWWLNLSAAFLHDRFVEYNTLARASKGLLRVYEGATRSLVVNKGCGLLVHDLEKVRDVMCFLPASTHRGELWCC